MIKRLALSGQLFSGKDWIADKAGYRIIGLADPMYKIADYYFGTHDKRIPGIREFLQYVGQIGWGRLDNDRYKLSTERATLIHQIREDGNKMCDMGMFIKWEDFGKSKTFWIDILIDRVILFYSNEPKLAVTNIRFEHELPLLKEWEFEHYHSMCAEDTRRKRLGSAYNPEADKDVSEQFALRMNTEMPHNRIIWNDNDVEMPEPKDYLSIDKFIELTDK